MPPASLLQRARRHADDLVALRRDLHRHPELSFREERTAGVVVRELTDLGLAPRTGIARTGVVAEIGDGPGPTVALRADMDALPIDEDADHEYASTVPGVMHACGHDAHTAGLIGAARLLVEARDAGTLPPGRIRLLFQPSEETVDDEGLSGASRLIEEGALEGVDAVAGLHVGATLPTGRFFVAPGPIMGGGQEVEVVIRGVAAHAALPHEGVDALLLAAQGIQAVHAAVARRLAPTDTGVVGFGVVEGGRAPNVVCDRVRLHGTMRWFDPGVKAVLEEAVRGAFEGLEAQGARVEVIFRPGYPPVVNDARATAVARSALTELAGEDAVWDLTPALLAEDFAFLARAAPGVFVWLGAALAEPRQHHHPRFDIDESVLPVGAAALAQVGMTLLREYRA
jgi:amidohydrolase